MKQTPHSAEQVEKPRAQNPQRNQGSPQAEPPKSSWEFYFIVAVIAAGIIALFVKAVGLF